MQAPHDEVSQPMLVPVRPSSSRTYWTSSVRGSTSWCARRPLTMTVISMVNLPRFFGLWTSPRENSYTFRKGRAQVRSAQAAVF